MRAARAFRAFFASLATAACVLAAAPAGADDLRSVERELIRKAAEESRLKNEADARRRELDALRAQLVDAAKALQDAERKIDDAAEEIERLSQEEKTIDVDLRREQAAVSDVLAALQSIERSKPPALLVSPDDANRAARTAMLLADAAPALEAQAAALREKIAALRTVREDLAAQKARFEQTNRELGARRDVLAGLIADKRDER
ncbi:MAG: hypothetical protein AAGC56_14195, partial [Pseudomonadota bacterium]